MDQLIWKLFIETGNIETYLLLKSIENEHSSVPESDMKEVGNITLETRQ